MLQAVAIDPGYAPAWSSLASMQVGMAEWTFEKDPAPIYASAGASARRALSLDPDNARALRMLGYIEILGEWDTVSAARWFGKALIAAPGDSATLDAIAYLYSRLRPARTAGFIEDTEDRDPLDAGALLNRVFGSLYDGDLDAARQFLDEATQLEPDAIRVRAAEALIAYLDGDFESALRLATDSTPPMRACALYRLGRTGEADRELNELVNAGPSTAYHVAAVHACRGDVDAAFESLNRAWEYRDQALLTIRGNWYMSTLHEDPRWPLLLETIGVSDKHAEQVDAILEPVLYSR
jgi:Flp pilus assembly protein TadD